MDEEEGPGEDYLFCEYSSDSDFDASEDSKEELGEFENSIEKLLSTPLACKSEPAVETALEEARPRLKSEAQKDH